MLTSSLAQEMVQLAKNTIISAYRPGVGITSSASDGIFAKTIWTRDLTLVSLVSGLFPEELATTIATLIRNQHECGILPIRVQWVDVFLSYVAGFFGLEKWLGKKEIKPWYETSSRAVPARDTVYCLIISCFNLYQDGIIGKEFVEKIIPCLVKALETEEKHVDPKDQLVVSQACSDWGDCVKRKGKLVSINILRYQALRIMALFLRKDRKLSSWYLKKAEQVLSSCIEVFWDNSRGCFTVSARDKRLDTFANIFASFWLKDLNQCVRIQNALEQEVRDNVSGLLKCYSWPYAWHEISLLRTVGMVGYGNTFLYPLLSDLNILAQVKIASCHSDLSIKRNFAERAEARFANQTGIHAALKTFHEVLNPETYQPAQHPFFAKQFKSHPSFTPAAATYLAAALSLSNFQAP